MQIKSVSDVAVNGVKILVYGDAGVGKTRLISTLPGRVLLLSAESGLLSLAGVSHAGQIDVAEIGSVDDLRAAFALLSGDHPYTAVALDSISEIAEVVLVDEKAKTKDPRQAYGALHDVVTRLLRAFRDLPLHVLVSAKLARTKDEGTGRVSIAPSLPGQRLGADLPYLFDEVFRLVVEESDVDGAKIRKRWLMTAPDGRSMAKDRSGKLDELEPPDLGALIDKISAQ